MLVNKGANAITIQDIEDFLNGGGAVTPTATENQTVTSNATTTAQTESSPAAQPNGEPVVTEPAVTETQAFARRLREATGRARNDERESIAKSFGYESYDAMVKAREANILREKGLDPEDVSPVVEQIVEQRIATDSRLQELEAYRQDRMSAWAKQELAELKTLTDGKISSWEDVPKDVLEAWKTKGSLKAAYLELRGETLIMEMRTSIASGQSKGSTGHLASPAGAPAASNEGKRPFTEEERRIYKMFNPGVTDEQLSKMTKDV